MALIAQIRFANVHVCVRSTGKQCCLTYNAIGIHCMLCDYSCDYFVKRPHEDDEMNEMKNKEFLKIGGKSKMIIQVRP